MSQTIETPNVQTLQPFVFTRYLYSKIEVKQSLLVSLLDRNCAEALFWAYELYYSGYNAEVFEYLLNVNDWIYCEDNQNINRYIHSLHDKWIVDSTLDWHLGSIVATLCGRRYQLYDFMHSYFNVKVTNIDNKHVNTKTLFVHFSKKDIESYQTYDVNNKMPHLYLKESCKYATRKEVNNLFKTEKCEFTDEYRNHWEYYTFRCPYWNEIYEKYNCTICDEKKCILFPYENCEEAFYNKYAIEPDEQPLSVQQKSIGTGNEHILTLVAFCEKYGAKLPLQKIKISRK